MLRMLYSLLYSKKLLLTSENWLTYSKYIIEIKLRII